MLVQTSSQIICCLLELIKMWPWYLGWCYRTPLQCPHHSRPCNYTGTRLQLSAKYIISRGAKILFMWERDILPNSGHKKSGGFWYWANPDAPDTITSKPEARKLLNSLTKIYFIQHDSDWTSHWQHYWLLDEEFMIIRGMLFVIQSWLFRSSLLLWTVIDNLILGRTQCSQTQPWPGPEPSSRRLRVGRKQNQWEQ